MRSLNKIYIVLIGLLLISQAGCGEAVKKTPMQKVENMAYCWTPDGKVAFYRRIDHWIKMEPDPFPGGGGVYDDYEKNDEGFIVIRDLETKKEEILNKVLDPKYPSAPFIRWLDWSAVNELIVLSAGGSICIIKPGDGLLKVLTPEVPRKSDLFRYYNTPTWSPNGKKILYTASENKKEKGGLFIMDADCSNNHLLIENGMSGSWSPDGKQIVYQTAGRRATEEDFKKLGVDYLYTTQDIYIINTDGTGKKLLLEGGANPIWSQDGKWILCGTKLITPDGSEVVKIKVPGIFSRWAPNMKYLLSLEGFIQEFNIEGEVK